MYAYCRFPIISLRRSLVRFSTVAAPSNDGQIAPNANRPDRARSQWSTVQPFLSKTQKENSKTIASIEITPQCVVWSVLDVESHKVVSVGSAPLFTADGKICHSTVIDLSHQTKELIPKSDLFVMENKGIFKGQTSSSAMYMNLFKYQAMLSVLLNENFNVQCPVHRVFLMHTKVVSKLFHLEIGSERVSSQHIIWNMIKDSPMANALPVSRHNWDVSNGTLSSKNLNWSCSELVRQIWSRDDMWRENVCNSILTATAFSLVCVREDQESITSLWRRPKKAKPNID